MSTGMDLPCTKDAPARGHWPLNRQQLEGESGLRRLEGLHLGLHVTMVDRCLLCVCSCKDSLVSDVFSPE